MEYKIFLTLKCSERAAENICKALEKFHGIDSDVHWIGFALGDSTAFSEIMEVDFYRKF